MMMLLEVAAGIGGMSTLLGGVGLAFGAAIALWCLYSSRKSEEYEDSPPGDLGIISQIRVIAGVIKGRDPDAVDVPPIEKAKMGGQIVVSITDPDFADIIVRGEGRITEPNSAFLPGLDAVLGENTIFLLQGQKHKKLRSQLLPAFTTRMINAAVDQMQPMLHRRAKQWSTDGVFDGGEVTKHIAANFGCAFIGLDVDRYGDHFMKLVREVTESQFSLRVNLPGTTYHKGLKSLNELYEKYIRPMIRDRVENPRTGKDAEGDLITLLLNYVDENGVGITKDVLEVNLFSFVQAAVDTTQSSMCSFLIEMCKNPDIQDKLRAEMNEVLGDEIADDALISQEQVAEMRYLDMVFLEVGRRHPVVPGVFFRKVKKTFELGGYTIQKGWAISLLTHLIALSEKRFKNPRKFDPERFRSPESEGNEHRRLLLDFGYGSRQCMGKRLADRERKLFAINLLRRHRIEFANGREPKLSNFRPQRRLLEEFPVRVTKV